MSKLTKLALNRPVSTIIMIMGIIIFGLSSILGLNMQLIPDMEMPMLIVTTVYPQAGPEEVERLVTQKIEGAGGTIGGLNTIQSSSSENVSLVIFQFEYGTNMDDAYLDLQEDIQQVKNDLPESALSPTIVSLDVNDMASMGLSLTAEGNMDLLTFAKDEIETELRKITAVADVTISGGQEEYISIELMQEKLSQYGLTMNSIAGYISSANFTIPAGTVEHGNQQLNLSSNIEYNTVEQLSLLPITTASGELIRLLDVANVHYSVKDAESVSRYNGKDNIGIEIQKRQNANAITLSEKVEKVVEQINKDNPGIHLEIFYDSKDAILSSLQSVGETLILGIALSMAVLFVFFGDLKGSLIVGSSMPVSLLVTFILMGAMGYSLNIVTMGSLVIGIGMMVDNSIVVLEICFRKREEQLDYKEAAYEGVKMVANSISASTLTTIVVFFPLALLKGLSGQMFSQLGFTIIFSLVASLISALTLVPLFFFKYKPKEKREAPISKFITKLSLLYGHALERVLNRKFFVALLSIGIFGFSIYLATWINRELMPQTDEGQITLSVTFRPNLQLEEKDRVLRELEEFIGKDIDVETYSLSSSGASSNGTVTAYLRKGRSRETLDIVDEWSRQLNNFETCQISISSTSSSMMSVGGNATEIDLQASNLEVLKEASKQVEEVMRSTKGVLSVSASMSDTGTKAKVIIDPMKAIHTGFTPAQVASLLYTTMTGQEALTVDANNKNYSVILEYPKGQYGSVHDLGNLSFASPKGTMVPLFDMAEIEYSDTPQTIQRREGQYLATITASLSNEDKFTAPAIIQEKVDRLTFPKGVEQGVSSDVEMLNEEFTALGLAIATAIILVFMVMAMQFESLRFSAMVMICIPFSLIGSVFLLFVTKSTFSMVSLMGFLMLVGTVVNNGILYVDTTNQFRETMDVETALIETGKSRLRPILMTTLTTVLSMLPLCFGIGDNGQMMQGMAVVIVGGLTASTILTLFLLPTFYLIIHKKNKNEIMVVE